MPDSFVEFTKITHLEVAHFTSSSVIPSIRRFGIQPRAGGALAIEDGLFTEPDDVYLVSGVDKLYFERAVKTHGGVAAAVVVQVSVSMLRADVNILVPGKMHEWGELKALHHSLLGGACCHRGAIAPTSILAVVDNFGVPIQ